MPFESKYKDFIERVPFGKYKGSPISVLFDDIIYAKELSKNDGVKKEYPEFYLILNSYFSNIEKNNKKHSLNLNEKNVIDEFIRNNIEKQKEQEFNISLETVYSAFESWSTINNHIKISKKKLIYYLNKKLYANIDNQKKQLGWSYVKLNFCK